MLGVSIIMIDFISLAIYGGVAALMIGIGISQLRSKKPVGFYSGVKPPREDELSDVGAWNKKHGIMWIIYGAIILIVYALCVMIGDNIYSALFMCGGLIVPVFIMMYYHRHLENTYRK